MPRTPASTSTSTSLPLGPVRLLLDGRGQRPQPRRAVGQARADRRDRARGLGLAAVSAFGFCAARGRRWRAGPVAGHGLRLRKLRLRGVSRATRPNTVFARPGSTAGVAVRERDGLRDRSSCARSVCPALRPSDAAAVVCLRIGEPPGSLAVSSHDDPPPLDATARDHRCASQPTPTPAFTREAGASDRLRGSVALPPKQARAYGASRLALLVRSGCPKSELGEVRSDGRKGVVRCWCAA